MIEKANLAKQRAQEFTKLVPPEDKIKPFFTGRIIVLGKLDEQINPRFDPKELQTLTPELNRLGKVVLSLSLLRRRHLQKLQTPSMSAADAIKTVLRNNRRSVKNHPDTNIFDQNGLVEKKGKKKNE